MKDETYFEAGPPEHSMQVFTCLKKLASCEGMSYINVLLLLGRTDLRLLAMREHFGDLGNNRM